MELLIRVTILFAGIVAIYGGVMQIAVSINGFIRYKGKATAQVERIITHPFANQDSYYFVYTYNGKEYTAVKKLVGNYAVIGKKKRIRINVDNPEDIYAGRVLMDSFMGGFVICMGLLCFLVLFYV